ncbi:MAG TPA: Gfo/Idh/MocA family oxidoreductase [Ilumatobacter sp.]
MSADRLRVGFIGTGLIATFHSKMLRAAEHLIERAGVYDLDVGRAERFAAASGHRVVADAEAVLDSCDAVYVCTWTSAHRPLVERAAERGRAVFCEKPLATSLRDAEAMADAVARHGVTNQIGLILRRSPAYLLARDLIADPVAGRVMNVVFRDDQFIPIQGHYASTWRADLERAGAGTLLEHSIHDVDMLCSLAGPIASVSARSANFHGHRGIEDSVAATVAFASGALGTLVSVWHDNLARPSLRRVEVFCERRHIVIEGDWFGPVRWTDADGGTGELADDELVAATAGLAHDGPHPDVAFVRAALDGTPARPDFALGVEAHRVVDAMYRSAAADGAPVEP